MSVFPMKFVALVALVALVSVVSFVSFVSLVSLVSLVSVVSLCYLVHQNGRCSRGISYRRNDLLIMHRIAGILAAREENCYLCAETWMHIEDLRLIEHGYQGISCHSSH